MSKRNSTDNILLRLADKVDIQYVELDRRLDNIEKVMIAQEINLKEHMKRSDSLEGLIEKIQNNDLKPLHRHVTMVEGVFKFLGLVALLLSIFGGIGRLFNFV